MTTLTFAQDALTLYGFADDAEREAFTAVQTVSGIGPRIALAILAQLTPSQLAKAVSAGDTAVLQRVPGIGRKGAQRLVLELAGKLVGDTAGLAAGALNATENEVITALQGLGWSEAVAGQAVAAVVESGSAQDVASLLRAALRQLGGKA
jgi:Holliday junction DNA helicase RuvA